jgi:hypothetical protein
MMAAGAACMLMAVGSAVSAKTLSTYNQIVGSLETGKSVFVNIKPEKCKVETSDGAKPTLTRFGIKFNDMVEWVNRANNGKEMKALGTQETGLFGNNKFDWFRDLTAIYEDGTVIVFYDHVESGTFNLRAREKITCKLSADSSGGVTVTELAG